MNFVKVPLAGGILTIVLILLSIYSPLGSVFMLLVALPVSVISLKWGLQKAFQSLIIGMLAVIFLFGLKAIILIVLIGSAALIQYISIKQKQNIFNYMVLFTTIAFIFLLAGFYYAGYFSNEAGVSLVQTFSKQTADIKEAYLQMGIPEKRIDSILQDLNELIEKIKLLLPAIYGIGLFTFLIINMFLTKIITKKLGGTKLFPLFKEWDTHWFFSWGYVLGIAFQLFGARLSENWKLLGLNVLVFFGVVFAIQGASVAAYFLNKWKVSKAGKIISAISLFILPPLVQLLSWVGLFDVWFNYRKLERRS